MRATLAPVASPVPPAEARRRRGEMAGLEPATDGLQRRNSCCRLAGRGIGSQKRLGPRPVHCSTIELHLSYVLVLHQPCGDRTRTCSRWSRRNPCWHLARRGSWSRRRLRPYGPIHCSALELHRTAALMLARLLAHGESGRTRTCTCGLAKELLLSPRSEELGRRSDLGRGPLHCAASYTMLSAAGRWVASARLLRSLSPTRTLSLALPPDQAAPPWFRS